MSRRNGDLLGQSASTYLLLCAAFGLHRACFIVTVAGVLALWLSACRRWPWFAWFSVCLIRGFVRR
jgi:hypothetical protein